MARTAGYGAKDASGNFYFKALGDGEIKLGNSSDDVVQITGSIEMNESLFFTNDGKIGIGDSDPSFKLSVGGSMEIGQYIYHKGDNNTFINFTDNRIRINAGGTNFIDCEDPGSAPHKVRINNGGNNIDFDIKDKNNNVYFTADASTSRVGIGTTTPSVDLEVDGTIKGEYYITTPTTQDLGSGTSSTLSIGSSLMFLDADSITGQDLGLGMDVHTLNIPNGTTSGQRLTLVVEGNMGSGNSVGIMVAGNLAGASDMFMPNAKTSLNFVYYSTASISAWYQV